MWTSEMPYAVLAERNRWKVEFFCAPSTSDLPPSAFDMLSIGELVKERKGGMEPASEGDRLVSYLGLENVQSLTGQLVNFEPRQGRSIKSRSKLFFADDVLYGRLRPNLNKVFLAAAPVTEGLCSGEFFVFVPNREIINPVVLRYLLASDYVQRHATRFQIGTALPRMNLDDLLEIKVPVPPLPLQEKYAKTLLARFTHLVEVKREADTLPLRIASSFLAALETGSSQIS